ncbi:MAG: hypothetical protein ABIT92_00905 [Gammaproteobacteria bacterium]
MKLYAALFIIAALLVGCDSDTQPEPVPPKLFKEDIEALNKAKGVQQTIDRQAEESRENIDKAEQGR